jgi:uncharacterized membrane protein
MAKLVNIGDAVRFGWETFGRNVAFLLAVYIAAMVISVDISGATEMEMVSGPAEFVLYILQALASAVLEMGLIAIAIQFVDGHKPEFGDLFNRVHLVIKYIAAQIVVGLMIMAGLILFIFPGIYLAIRFSFFGYFIVTEECGPLDALQKTWDLTKGHTLDLLVFYLAVIGINILGLMAFVVGIFVTLPITSLATAVVFRRLQGPPVTGEEAAATHPV